MRVVREITRSRKREHCEDKKKKSQNEKERETKRQLNGKHHGFGRSRMKLQLVFAWCPYASNYHLGLIKEALHNAFSATLVAIRIGGFALFLGIKPRIQCGQLFLEAAALTIGHIMDRVAEHSTDPWMRTMDSSSNLLPPNLSLMWI